MMKRTYFTFTALFAAKLALGGPALPKARAVVAPAAVTRTAIPLPHRTTSSSFTSQPAIKAVKKRQQRQIPFQFCPEFFGEPPKACSECGGDTKQAGICDRILVSGEQFNCPPAGPYDQCNGYFCQCTPDHTPQGPQVTMTTVIDGATGTVVWEPMTLEKYTGLRAKTTVTLTETATQTSGDEELETVVAAVFAGGVAWWVASQSGAVGAALAIPPPSQPPEGAKEDDSICKSNPKEECKNCGGANAVGLCQSGTEAGCPCDVVQNCPNEPLFCDDPTCGGDNGQNQCKAEGEINGCLCCPKTPASCDDPICNGDANAVCQTDRQKGCSCRQFADGDDFVEDPDDPDLQSDQDQSSLASQIFTSVWSNDPRSVPGFELPPQSTSCDIVTSTFTTSVVGPPTQTFCECEKTIIAGLNFATSGTVTTSYCAIGLPVPDGFTQVPADGSGHIITSDSSSSPPTTTPPPTTTDAPPPSSSTMTATSCNFGWCGAPFCDPLCGP